MADKFILGFPISEKTANSELYQDGVNIGIGTTSPLRHLEVDPNSNLNANPPSEYSGTVARFGGNVVVNSGDYLILDDTYSSHGTIRYNGTGVSESKLEINGYYGINFQVRGGATKMVIKGDSGNVGIGTTSPLYKLQVQDRIHVQDVTNQQPKISFSENTDAYGEFVLEYNGVGGGAGNYVSFYSEVPGWVTKGNGLNYIPYNGNVGIGTTSPGQKLHVNGNIRANGEISNVSQYKVIASNGNGIRFWDGSSSFSIFMGSDDYGGRLDSTSDYNMYFQMTGGTNRGFVFKNGSTPTAQIDASGNIIATGNITANNLSFNKLYKIAAVSISNSYVRVAEIDETGGQLSSSVRVTMTAHGSSHVTTCTAIISVGHSQDILIQSSNLNYTQVTLKVESNNNGLWTLSVKSSSANAAVYNFDIQGLSNNLTITPYPSTSQSGTTLEHTTNFGTNVTGTGGSLQNKFGGVVTASGGIARQSGGSTTAGVKFWSGTKAQYDALGSGRDANTIYYVTDE